MGCECFCDLLYTLYRLLETVRLDFSFLSLPPAVACSCPLYRWGAAHLKQAYCYTQSSQASTLSCFAWQCVMRWLNIYRVHWHQMLPTLLVPRGWSLMTLVILFDFPSSSIPPYGLAQNKPQGKRIKFTTLSADFDQSKNALCMHLLAYIHTYIHFSLLFDPVLLPVCVFPWKRALHLWQSNVLIRMLVWVCFFIVFADHKKMLDHKLFNRCLRKCSSWQRRSENYLANWW